MHTHMRIVNISSLSIINGLCWFVSTLHSSTFQTISFFVWLILYICYYTVVKAKHSKRDLYLHYICWYARNVSGILICYYIKIVAKLAKLNDQCENNTMSISPYTQTLYLTWRLIFRKKKLNSFTELNKIVCI